MFRTIEDAYVFIFGHSSAELKKRSNVEDITTTTVYKQAEDLYYNKKAANETWWSAYPELSLLKAEVLSSKKRTVETNTIFEKSYYPMIAPKEMCAMLSDGKLYKF